MTPSYTASRNELSPLPTLVASIVSSRCATLIYSRVSCTETFVQVLRRTYHGSGRYEYGKAMLNLWLNSDYEFTRELSGVYLENMFVNPSGREGA